MTMAALAGRSPGRSESIWWTSAATSGGTSGAISFSGFTGLP